MIPVELRRELGIQQGDRVVARVEEGRLILEDRRSAVRRLRGSWRSFSSDRDLVNELAEARRAEAALEEAELGADEEAIGNAREQLSRVGRRHIARAGE